MLKIKDKNKYNKILKTAIFAAKSASKYIFNERFNIKINEKKEDNSFVTHVDKNAEKIIRKIILDKFPSHEIYGEEEGYKKKDSDFIWFVDPIDGTHNYMAGLPFYAVSIGVSFKEELVASVILLPEFGDMYYASKGNGAFLNNKKLEIKKDQIKKIISYEYGPDNKSKIIAIKIINYLMFSNFGSRKIGSTACELAFLSEGLFSGYIDIYNKPYDIAAGFLIVKEAGGIVTNIKGNNKKLLSSNIHICAINKKIHTELLTNLKKINGEN